MDAGAGQGLGRWGCGAVPQEMCAVSKEGRCVGRPAHRQILMKALAVMGGKRGVFHQLRIGVCVARQHGEHDAFLPREARDLSQPVSPVGLAAQQPQHDKLRSRQRLLAVEIDRVVVLELQQVGQPQRRRTRLIVGPRQGREFAVGRREHHHLRRLLVEVDGLGCAVDDAGGGGEKVHQPRSSASMAARSMCFSPITTSWVSRVSPGFHGRSK